jgi:hypothetical protein
VVSAASASANQRRADDLAQTLLLSLKRCFSFLPEVERRIYSRCHVPTAGRVIKKLFPQVIAYSKTTHLDGEGPTNVVRARAVDADSSENALALSRDAFRVLPWISI